jgi:UDP-glucose 4-epimerase
VKRVLIFGAESYIGVSFERHVKGRLLTKTIDARDNGWRDMDFSKYDSILYVAGIAHRKQSGESKALYFAVNRDLAHEAAQKAKADGAGQFVYMSSLYAFGVHAGEITPEAEASPAAGDWYGQSKYEAEKLLLPMRDEAFRVAVIRPPMVYGPGCKGNFPRLVKLAGLLPILPTLENRRSMIYIENLAELLAIVAEENASGVLCPQNAEYAATAEMLGLARVALGKKARRTGLLNLPIRLAMPVCPPIKNAFGSLWYSREVSAMPFERPYQLIGLADSIEKSVRREENA